MPRTPCRTARRSSRSPSVRTGSASPPTPMFEPVRPRRRCRRDRAPWPVTPPRSCAPTPVSWNGCAARVRGTPREGVGCRYRGARDGHPTPCLTGSGVPGQPRDDPYWDEWQGFLDQSTSTTTSPRMWASGGASSRCGSPTTSMRSSAGCHGRRSPIGCWRACAASRAKSARLPGRDRDGLEYHRRRSRDARRRSPRRCVHVRSSAPLGQPRDPGGGGRRILADCAGRPTRPRTSRDGCRASARRSRSSGGASTSGRSGPPWKAATTRRRRPSTSRAALRGGRNDSCRRRARGHRRRDLAGVGDGARRHGSGGCCRCGSGVGLRELGAAGRSRGDRRRHGAGVGCHDRLRRGCMGEHDRLRR